MCGRYTLATPTEALAELFQLQTALPSLRPRYNIAPTQPVAVVRRSTEGEREMVIMHWGLIPSWAKEPDIGNRLINARSETVSEKPSFRSAFKRRRCLVPTDGFYEWQRLNKRKQPHYVRMGDGEPFAFAGLWERWDGQDETVIESCTILTTEANAFVRPIHNRMPVIVEPGNYDLWLEAEPDRTGALARLMRPYSGDRLTAFPISTWVNSPKNDDARCVEPIEHPKD